MASNQTTYYQLSQWLPEDAVLRTDFNGDNVKIDAALRQLTAGKADKAALDTALGTLEGLSVRVPKIAAGTYTGTGEASQVIPLEFTPKIVLVCTAEGWFSDGNYSYGGLAMSGVPAYYYFNNVNRPIVQIQQGGFSVYCYDTKYDHVWSNFKDKIYHYAALG